METFEESVRVFLKDDIVLRVVYACSRCPQLCQRGHRVNFPTSLPVVRLRRPIFNVTPGPVLDSALRLTFNSVSARNRGSDLTKPEENLSPEQALAAPSHSNELLCLTARPSRHSASADVAVVRFEKVALLQHPPPSHVIFVRLRSFFSVMSTARRQIWFRKSTNFRALSFACSHALRLVSFVSNWLLAYIGLNLIGFVPVARRRRVEESSQRSDEPSHAAGGHRSTYVGLRSAQSCNLHFTYIDSVTRVESHSARAGPLPANDRLVHAPRALSARGSSAQLSSSSPPRAHCLQTTAWSTHSLALSARGRPLSSVAAARRGPTARKRPPGPRTPLHLMRGGRPLSSVAAARRGPTARKRPPGPRTPVHLVCGGRPLSSVAAARRGPTARKRPPGPRTSLHLVRGGRPLSSVAAARRGPTARKRPPGPRTSLHSVRGGRPLSSVAAARRGPTARKRPPGPRTSLHLCAGPPAQLSSSSPPRAHCPQTTAWPRHSCTSARGRPLSSVAAARRGPTARKRPPGPLPAPGARGRPLSSVAAARRGPLPANDRLPTPPCSAQGRPQLSSSSPPRATALQTTAWPRHSLQCAGPPAQLSSSSPPRAHCPETTAWALLRLVRGAARSAHARGSPAQLSSSSPPRAHCPQTTAWSTHFLALSARGSPAQLSSSSPPRAHCPQTTAWPTHPRALSARGSSAQLSSSFRGSARRSPGPTGEPSVLFARRILLSKSKPLVPSRKRCNNNACSFEPRSVVSGSAHVRVCGVPRSVNRAAAVKPRASVPVTSSGYPAVCTPSPHTVSAPRVRSSSFHTPMPIAILVISRVFTRVNGFCINCVSATACGPAAALWGRASLSVTASGQTLVTQGFLTFAPLAPCAFWPLR
ncbi:hypothetical protein EVAR_88767_1 [Eumeta japonica]|uniref:Uncharacterized protein n=1 Tax=Eumeta variegata TaxID=151549 RepID=A0A4C1XTQ1_EUMVA|nr:hypothetical protein EVAR_88767_1 [Eumeta japonica]